MATERRAGPWLMVAAAAALGAPLVWLVMPRRLPVEPLPVPNGYDDIVAATRMLSGSTPNPPGGDYTKVDAEELRAYVARNAEALERVRVGLGRESRVPMRAGLTQAQEAELIHQQSAARDLGRLLVCEAAVAEREGRMSDAARGYADAVRLGGALAHGGLLFHRQVGLAVASSGSEPLGRLASAIPADDARRLAAEVERVERGFEPVDRVMARDKGFYAVQGGWQGRAISILHPGMVRRMRQAGEKATEDFDRRVRALLRVLAAKLALRAYRLDHPGDPPPTDLAALVPGDLKAVPADPYGRGPLKLKAGKDGLLVYSVGPDGRDDGGKPLPRRAAAQGPNLPPGDLTLGPLEGP